MKKILLTLRGNYKKKDMAKFTTSTIHEEYIAEDGSKSVRDSRKVVKFTTEDNPFYMTFINFVGWMWELKGEITIRVLTQLMGKAQYNTGTVNLSSADRDDIMDALHISSPALSRAISELVSKGVIAKVTKTDKNTGEVKEYKGRYMINPQMFWKGELDKRKELLVTFSTTYIEDPITNKYSPEDVPPKNNMI